MKCYASEEKYHVFLSFRGRDLRRGFVDHLYSSLTTTAKLNVFLDSEEIEPGDEIAHQIEKAIQGSSIRIPIFSKNYAESAWCLKEVALMCASPQSLTIPLFYDVTPAAVRYPDKGPFAPFFEKHNHRFPQHTIAEWKSALFTVSSLSGWSLDMTQGYEGKLVKLVIQDVLNKLNNVPLDVAEFVVGLEERKAQVIRLLGIDLDKSSLRTVGICGMGGVGKTTLAKAIYNDIYLKFEAACFVSDVRLKAQQVKGISQIQGQVLKDLLKVEYQVNDDAHGKALIKDRLRYLRSLVILDDVDSSMQLDAIRGDWFGEGSRIIVTSRNKNALNNRKADEIYDMEGIPADEGLQLFSWHAFLQPSPDKEFEDLSLMVVEHCGGLPLSLEVIGGLLYEKRDRKFWVEALKQLQSAMYESIHGRLKISYEGLNSNEKEIFLDIACLFLGKDTETAITFWEASDLAPNITVMNLVLKSLIRISDEGTFLMHDHLRDMAIAIVAGESKKPGKRSRLWKPHEVQQVLKYNQGTESVRCLILDGGDLDMENFVLDIECLIPMQNLQLLWASGITIQGSFGRLSPHLRWLKLEFSSGLDCLGWQWDMEHLSILDLNGSDIKTLWSRSSRSKVPKNLKVLNLNHCHQLMGLPDLSSYTSLVSLQLNDCKHLTRIPNYFGLLQELKYLSLSSSEDLEFLHSITKLSSLKNLLLSGCYGIKVLPSRLEELSSLEVLDLSSTSIEQLPDLPFLNLKKLVLLRCDKLKSLPESIGRIRCLTYLELDGCLRLTALPPSIGELRSLRSLYMKSCIGMSCLPEEIRNLVSLRELVMNQCWNLTELPQIGTLVNLESLLLNGCSQLSSLPLDIGQLKSLIFLDLGYCTRLKSLPVSIGELKSLHSLDMSYCIKIKQLPEELGNIVNLENLKLRHCYSLVELPRLGNLLHLRVLDLYKSSCISNLFQSLCGLKSLVTVEAANCNIEFLPQNIGDLQSLEYLNMERNTFYTLPSSVSLLVQLNKLIIRYCENLEELPILPGGLVKVDVSECPQLQKVGNLSPLNKLEVLIVCNCGKLFELPGLGTLRSLKELNLAGCINLKALDNIEQLQSLEKMYFNNCPSSIMHVGGWIKGIPRLQEISCSAYKVPKCLQHKLEAKMMEPSGAPEYLEISLPPEKYGITYSGILFCLHLQFKKREFRFVEDEGTLVISLIRDDGETWETAMSLNVSGNKQNNIGDRLCVLLYRGNHPLVSSIRDGDRIRVKSAIRRWILIKDGAMELLGESQVNGYSNEKAVLEALSLELQSLVSTYPNRDADVENEYTILSHNDQINMQQKTDQTTPRNNTGLKKRCKKFCCVSIP